MAKHLALGLLAVLLWCPPSSAQVFEASAGGGFTTSDGVDSDDLLLLGTAFNEVTVDSGGSFNFTIGGFVTEQFEIEFLWSRQSSEFGVRGLGGELAVSELSLMNYHGNFVYNWGYRNTRTRPFAFAGFGATSDSFGDLLLPSEPGSGIDGDTRFSTTWGGGVKLYFHNNVGAKLMGRWTPTYIRTDPEGVWCDPFYGCWTVGDPQYVNQLEFSAGITTRF